MNSEGQRDQVIALAVDALMELGAHEEGRETTAGIDAVLELMQLACEKIDVEEQLDPVKQHPIGRTSSREEFRLTSFVASVLGDDYKHVTLTGEGLPRGFSSCWLSPRLRHPGIVRFSHPNKTYYLVKHLRV